MYDELESTNDTTCLRNMLNNNSNNDTIYLECVLGTHICVCVHGMQSHICLLSFLSFCRNHLVHTFRACLKTPSTNLSHITSSLSVFCAAWSAPCPAWTNRATSLQIDILPAETARIWILSEPLIQTLRLQMGGCAAPNPPLFVLALLRRRVCEKFGGGFKQFN